MIRPLAATALAALLALTPMAAAPARADQRDVARLLAGAATVFIIGKAIQNNRDKKKEEEKRKAEVSRDSHDLYRYDRRDGRYERHDDRRDDRHDHDRGRDRGPQNGDHWRGQDGWRNGRAAPRERLPAACREGLRTRSGTVGIYGSRCLSQNMRDARRLPSHCETSVWLHGRSRPVYEASCLAREGWTL